ncbi:hypothetical protein [Nocardioides insulae]|uniref:hypothetical protein n=1 Tax=Nocardioides insulae TaxID=394734 RepID=UPI00040A9359|nr:hypothetical protein [Nocardioides insulae]
MTVSSTAASRHAASRPSPEQADELPESLTITPLRRTPLRLFTICLLLLVSSVAWRRGEFYSGGFDTVVAAKAALTLLALLLVLTAPVRGLPWARFRAGPVPWLILYAALATTGALLNGDAFSSAVLAGRLGLLTLILVLLFRHYPRAEVLSALLSAMLALALVGSVTGVGSLATEGRLYGGIPPLNANTIALLVSLPLICLCWRWTAHVVRPVELLAIAPLLGLLWLTGTRTGLAAVLVALLILVVMAPRLPGPVVALTVVSVPTLLAVFSFTPLLSGYLTRGDSASDLVTLNSRTVAWRAALEYPDDLTERLLGAGLAQKVIPVSAMYRHEQILDSTWVSAIVQAGFLGTAVLALIVLTTLTRLLTEPPPLRGLLVASVGMLTLISVMESGLFDTSVTFIAFCCFALSGRPPTERRTR